MTEEFREQLTANIDDLNKAIIEQTQLEAIIISDFNDEFMEMSRHIRFTLVFAMYSIKEILAECK